MRKLVWLLIFLLIVLHQDNWLWDDPRLAWGFLPVGLLYHVVLSLAAAAAWYLATVFCWPRELESSAAAPDRGEQP